MKSKDTQKLVLFKYENGKGPSEIFQYLNGTREPYNNQAPVQNRPWSGHYSTIKIIGSTADCSNKGVHPKGEDSFESEKKSLNSKIGPWVIYISYGSAR